MKSFEYFKITEKRTVEIMDEILDYLHSNLCNGLNSQKLVEFADSNYKGNENKLALHFCGYIHGKHCKEK